MWFVDSLKPQAKYTVKSTVVHSNYLASPGNIFFLAVKLNLTKFENIATLEDSAAKKYQRTDYCEERIPKLVCII